MDATVASNAGAGPSPTVEGLVVVGVDGSETSVAALEWALEDSALRGGRCRAIRACRHPDPGEGDPARRRLLGAEQAVLDGLVATVRSRLDRPVEVDAEVVIGDAPTVLKDRADRAEALVVGSRGRHALTQALLGSVSESCLHDAPCPVVVIPARAAARRPRRGRVVVGIDGSAAALAALLWAADEAARRNADLKVVHAWKVPGSVVQPFAPSVPVDPAGVRRQADASLVEATASLVGFDHGRLIGKVVEGGPADVLLGEAEEADLLVLGGRGLGGWSGLLLGSVSQQCARHAPCPVAVVR